MSYHRLNSSSGSAVGTDGRDTFVDLTTADTLLLHDLANGSREQRPLDLSKTTPATDALDVEVSGIRGGTLLAFDGGSIRLAGVSGFDSISELQAAGYDILIG